MTWDTSIEGVRLWRGDAVALPLADNSVDLVIGSPPYLEARTYGLEGAARPCREWVEWMLAVTTEAVRVCRGLVAWVVSGTTKDGCYQPGPEGLVWEWYKRGNRLWRPAIYRRVGIPGSGGKQQLRCDWEYIVQFLKAPRLPWADNTATGHPPKYKPGGPLSHRRKNGKRRSEEAHTKTRKRHRKDVIETQYYTQPTIANPGNVIDIVDCQVGGGRMGEGDRFSRENEAPYPERVPEVFVLSYCRPGGVVCDPFCGSSTTGEVALRNGRQFWGCDLRQSQLNLSRRRLRDVTPLALLTATDASAGQPEPSQPDLFDLLEEQA